MWRCTCSLSYSVHRGGFKVTISGLFVDAYCVFLTCPIFRFRGQVKSWRFFFVACRDAHAHRKITAVVFLLSHALGITFPGTGVSIHTRDTELFVSLFVCRSSSIIETVDDLRSRAKLRRPPRTRAHPLKGEVAADLHRCAFGTYPKHDLHFFCFVNSFYCLLNVC